MTGMSRFTGESLVAPLYVAEPLPNDLNGLDHSLIGVVQVLTVEAQPGNDGVVRYLATLEQDGQTWSVSHRYREWHALYESLPQKMAAPFPAKLLPKIIRHALCLACAPTAEVAGGTGDDDTSTRAVALRLWAQELCAKRELLDVAAAFFGVTPASSCCDPESPSSSAVMDDAEIEEEATSLSISEGRKLARSTPFRELKAARTAR